MGQDLFRYQAKIEDYLKRTSAELAVFSFVNIFVWQDFFEFQFEEIDGNLCIFAKDAGGTFLYLPPLGASLSSVAIAESFARMAKLNRGTGVSRIENVTEKQLEFFKDRDFKIHKKGYEYVYYREDLEQLKGSALKSKRHSFNQFVKNYQGQVRIFETSMMPECLALYERWAEGKQAKSSNEAFNYMLEDNQLVHRRALMSANDLGLLGRVVEVDHKIVGYTFGYFLNEQVFCDFLEVTDVTYRGLAGYIFHELCADPLLQTAKFVNVMDDFEMENVTRTKLSYQPCLMLPAYIVSPES